MKRVNSSSSCHSEVKFACSYFGAEDEIVIHHTAFVIFMVFGKDGSYQGLRTFASNPGSKLQCHPYEAANLPK